VFTGNPARDARPALQSPMKLVKNRVPYYDQDDVTEAAQAGGCSHLASVPKIDPKKIERRRLSTSSTASCILARTWRLMAFITAGFSAASGGYCCKLIGGRNCVCHLEGNGTGKTGNVGVMGIKGQSL